MSATAVLQLYLINNLTESLLLNAALQCKAVL